MKNVLQWSILLLLSLSLNSCNSDDQGNVQNLSANPTVQKKTTDDPKNTANEYDNAGVLHNQLVEAFLLAPPDFISTHETIAEFERLTANNLLFASLQPNGLNFPTATQIDHILANESGGKDGLVNSLQISFAAKVRLKALLDELSVFRNNDTAYGLVYASIVSFETEVISLPIYNDYDRKVLLTTSSIARHAFYLAKKRKRPRDRDWDISWGSIFAGSDGSEENVAKAAVMSSVAGVVVSPK